MVVRDGLQLSLVGLVPGLTGGIAVAQLLRSVIFGLNPLDPVSIGGGVLSLLICAALAAVRPALRAARADPVRSLRVE